MVMFRQLSVHIFGLVSDAGLETKAVLKVRQSDLQAMYLCVLLAFSSHKTVVSKLLQCGHECPSSAIYFLIYFQESMSTQGFLFCKRGGYLLIFM